MRRMRSILFATDFREASRSAAEVAIHLAWVFGSRVTILHVMEPVPSWSEIQHHHREHATNQLRELSERLAGQKVEIEEFSTAVGHAADGIVQKAHDIDADLILIGAGERTRSDHFFLGPVAAAIMQHTTKPVLAIRPGDPQLHFRKILCPIDQSAVSARGLANAIRLTKAFGGQLIVLGVVPAASWISMVAETKSLAESRDAHDRAWRLDFDQFLAACPFDDVPFEREIRVGAPHQEIIAAAQAHHADLIVMGSTGRTGLARILMGSVTRRVIQQLPCSMLTVKHENVLEGLHEDEIRLIGLLFAQGKALVEAHSFEAAIAKFDHVLARNPFHLAALKARSDAYEQLGHSEEAARGRRRAQILDAHNNIEQEFDLGGSD